MISFKAHKSFIRPLFQFSQCYYKTLQVSAEASFEQIKSSYIQLAKKYHPDMLQVPDPSQQEKFKNIQEAYSILSDEQKRLNYDAINGLASYWSNQSQINSKFENEDKYQQFTNQDQVIRSVSTDDQFFNYFEKKYFGNPEFFKQNNLDVDANPFQVTPKLYREHKLNQNLRKQNDKYQIFFNGTGKAYYDEKPSKQYQNRTLYLLILYDLRYPIFLAFLLYTGNIIYQSSYKALQDKQESQSIQFLKESKGVIAKTMPINIV